MSKTIFMIHGMFCKPMVWDNYKNYFEKKGYNCITPCLRYHDMEHDGTPDAGLGTVSLLDYASDLEEEIKKLDNPPIIMGHSMGGLLAQILGSRGLAKSLVLLTPASPGGILAIKYTVLKSFSEILFKWGFWKNPFRISFDKSIYGALNLMPPDKHKELYSNMVYESGRAMFEIGYWLIDTKKASKVDESKVTCPVLIISGKKDRLTPASVVRNVASKYKSVSTFKEYENHAHWVIGEPGWEDITEYINNWLNQKSM